MSTTTTETEPSSEMTIAELSKCVATTMRVDEDDDTLLGDDSSVIDNPKNEKSRHVGFGAANEELLISNYRNKLTDEEKHSYWYSRVDMLTLSQKYHEDMVLEKEKKRQEEEEKRKEQERLEAEKKRREKSNVAKSSMAGFANRFGMQNVNVEKKKRASLEKKSKRASLEKKEKRRSSGFGSSMAAYVRTFGGSSQKKQEKEKNTTGIVNGKFVFPPEIESKKAVRELKIFVENNSSAEIETQRFMKVPLMPEDAKRAQMYLTNYYWKKNNAPVAATKEEEESAPPKESAVSIAQ